MNITLIALIRLVDKIVRFYIKNLITLMHYKCNKLLLIWNMCKHPYSFIRLTATHRCELYVTFDLGTLRL